MRKQDIDIFGNSLGESLFFAHVNEVQESEKYEFKNPTYSRRALRRSQTFLALAEFLGYTTEKYDKWLDYKYKILGW